MEGRFRVRDDGTVTDTCTGLVWQRTTADTNGDGYVTGEDQLNWQDALKFCYKLDLGGRQDWRLPNILELQSIIDLDRFSPAVAPPLEAVPRWHWSSTPQAATPFEHEDLAWYVDLDDGYLYHDLKRLRLYVRAVRSEAALGVRRNGDVNGDGARDLSDVVSILGSLFLGTSSNFVVACVSALPATGQDKCYDSNWNVITCSSMEWPRQDAFYRAGCPIEDRFVDNGDGTVSDSCTGLMWQKATADIDGDGIITIADNLDLERALVYCHRLDLAEHRDWRLPNIRELLSILDFGRFLPSIDPAFETENSWGWSSSTAPGSPGAAWVTKFSAGMSFQGYKTAPYLIRAVREGSQ